MSIENFKLKLLKNVKAKHTLNKWNVKLKGPPHLAKGGSKYHFFHYLLIIFLKFLC